MSRQWIVASPKQVPILTAEQLLRACQERFGDALVAQPQAKGPADYDFYVTPENAREFMLAHFRDNLSVSLGGTEEQNSELDGMGVVAGGLDRMRTWVAVRGWPGRRATDVGGDCCRSG